MFNTKLSLRCETNTILKGLDGGHSFLNSFIYSFIIPYSLHVLSSILYCSFLQYFPVFFICLTDYTQFHKSDLSYAYHIPKNLRMQNLQEENYIGIEAIKPTWLYWYALTFVRGGRAPSLLSPQLREIFFTTIYLSIAWEV